MNKHLRYSLLVVLAFAMTISLVKASPIGASPQARPYESNPTVATPTAGISGTFGNERDGNLGTAASFTGVAGTASGNVVFSSFKILPVAQQFPIAWVDIKIKYKHPGTGDDVCTIAYKTSGAAYSTLVTGTGATAKFDRDGNPAVRPWSNIKTYPGAIGLTWNDIQNLMIRILISRGTNAAWDATVDLYEIWLTVYETAPPAASTTVSLQPNSIMGLSVGQDFFVDIYMRDAVALWGYQFTIHYDTNVLTASSFFTYWPFFSAAPSWIDDSAGEVSASYTSYSGDLVGFSGNTPLCRIYFKVDGGGATKLSVDTSILSDPQGTSIAHNLYHGWFSANIVMSLQPPTILPIGAPLLGATWHELYPHYSSSWTLTSWIDNGDSDLSASDQIDMTNATGWLYWFHVDAVTITIHWTFKSPDTGTGEAEITPASREFTMTSPIGSAWHQVYPVYSRGFTITSWTDNGNGIFDPSDQFDFQYTPYDLLLVGPEPPKGSALTAPGVTNTYYDADFSGTWDVDELAIDDTDMDTMYTSGVDVVLAGVGEPADGESLSAPGVFDKFYDADSSGVWDVNEPAIRDADASGTYTPVETHWAHLDSVSTDIILSQKGPAEPGVPEFPLGISLIFAVAPLISVVYLWRMKPKKKVA